MYKADELAKLRLTLSTIYHDISNPISIVVGNAELLMEMAANAGLGPEFVDPLADIEKASRQISEHAERLIALRERVTD